MFIANLQCINCYIIQGYLWHPDILTETRHQDCINFCMTFQTGLLAALWFCVAFIVPYLIYRPTFPLYF